MKKITIFDCEISVSLLIMKLKEPLLSGYLEINPKVSSGNFYGNKKKKRKISTKFKFYGIIVNSYGVVGSMIMTM